MNNLTARQFETLGPGKHADGDNLHLIVSPTGQRRFIYSPRVGTKRPEYGFKVDTLKAARLERDRIKGLLAKGVDPRTEKPLDEKPAGPTFAKVIGSYISEYRSQWKPRTVEGWERMAVVDCAPIANMPLDDIDVRDIKSLLLTIFAKSPDKARRTKERINAVFGYAADHELCDRNRRSPAEGKTILPAAGLTGKHHAAMPYTEVPAFIAKLRERQALAATVLEFIILTATRAGEACGAQWSEFDIDNALWTIPIARMKTRKKNPKPHVVPLSPRAVEIIKQMRKQTNGDHVFPTRTIDSDGHIHQQTVYKLITEQLGLKLTTHGFRSSFRDWCGDATQYPREIAEMALAHKVGNAAELAYRRGSALEKRRVLMNDWAAYIEPADNVVQLRRA